MRSRDIGYGFEYRIRSYLHEIGYSKAIRKLMSGSAMKDPHDLVVSPYRLRIEAKRTMKDSIRITKAWLDKYIRKDRILVFAIGKKSGIPMSERMHAISMWPETPPIILSEAIANRIHMKKKSVRYTEKELIQMSSIQCGTKLYLVMKMKDYLRTFYPLTQEATTPCPTP